MIVFGGAERLKPCLKASPHQARIQLATAKACSRARNPGSTTKTGANPRPRKSLHRTVFRVWLLPNQERNRRWLAARGRLRKRQRALDRVWPGGAFETLLEGQPASSLQPTCNQPASSPQLSKPAHALESPVSLQKQERIKGPENAPIARFDGLCRSQIRSETGVGWRRAGGCANGSVRLSGFGRAERLKPCLKASPKTARTLPAPSPHPVRIYPASIPHPARNCPSLFTDAKPRFHCKNRSESKAPKTPPSHGFSGLAALKSGAKQALVGGARAVAQIAGGQAGAG